MDLVSVIVPVYNVEKYLKKCLDSIIFQSYKNLEIILIDDGSIDSSGKICDEYSQEDIRIKVIHQKNQGVAIARNVGIDNATGKWILFVDSDDWISSSLIDVCMKYLDESKEIAIFGHKREYQDMKSENEYLKLEENITFLTSKHFKDFQMEIFNRDRKTDFDKSLIKAASPCKIYNKEFLSKYELKFPEHIPTGEDGIFNLYVFKYATQGICIQEPLYFNRQRLESATHNYNPKIEKDLSALHLQYLAFLDKEKDKEFWSRILYERLIWSFSYCCILKYCHKLNPKNYRSRRNDFLELINSEEYRIPVKDVSLKNFGLKKGIVFLFIKKRFFLGIDILCKVFLSKL